jgi:hypothetical protein
LIWIKEAAQISKYNGINPIKKDNISERSHQ